MKRLTSTSRMILSLFSLLLLYSTPGMSAIYKWVDEQGNVHYSSERPADNSSEKMDVQFHAPKDTSTYKRPGQKEAATEQATDEKTPADKPAAEEEKKPMTAAEKKRLAAACQQARQQLATMKAKAQVRVRDKDGNTSFLSQQQKESRVKQMQDAVAKKCK